MVKGVHALLQCWQAVMCDVQGPMDLGLLGLGGLPALVGKTEAGEQRRVEKVVDVRDLPG